MSRQTKKVGIRKLKSSLSSYLREVRAGATILVLDRDECIAEISQPRAPSENPVLQAWAAAGEVVLPKRKKMALGRSPVVVNIPIVEKILDAERGE